MQNQPYFSGIRSDKVFEHNNNRVIAKQGEDPYAGVICSTTEKLFGYDIWESLELGVARITQHITGWYAQPNYHNRAYFLAYLYMFQYMPPHHHAKLSERTSVGKGLVNGFGVFLLELLTSLNRR